MRRNAILTTWLSGGDYTRDHVWVLEFAPYCNPPSAIVERECGAVQIVPIEELALSKDPAHVKKEVPAHAEAEY